MTSRAGFGVPVSPLRYEDLEARVLEWMGGGRCRTVMTMSFPMLGPYRRNPEYHAAMNASEVVLPDGMAVVWLSRWCGASIPERLAGPDFLERFSRVAAEQGLRYCLLGSTPEVLRRMAHRFEREFPGLVLAATISPPFGEWGPDVDKELVAAVNASRADILWVGITAPRQEIWLNRHRRHLTPPVAAAVGAAFDFFAGTRKRAPQWMRRMGLEWLHRVVREPLRLLPRYMRSLPAVFSILAGCRRPPRSGSGRP